MYVRNGYDGDWETVNVLARHTALKRWIATEILWYRNVVSRGSAVQSVALCWFLLWGCEPRLTRDQESLPSPEKNMWVAESVLDYWRSFSQTRPLKHFLPVAHFATCCQCVSNCHIPRGTAPRLPWYQCQAIGWIRVSRICWLKRPHAKNAKRHLVYLW